MDGLQACIAGVRRHSHNRSVAVMVGGPLFALQPDLAATLGADGTCSDARLAPAAAEGMLARRVKGA
jgi:methanogenic corrinoid protein MtbC1